MTAEADQLVRQAMTFPPDVRKEVADVLLASLAENYNVAQPPPDLIARLLERSREIHEGRVRTEPAREMIASLRAARGSAA